jgi:hypothetical protein
MKKLLLLGLIVAAMTFVSCDDRKTCDDINNCSPVTNEYYCGKSGCDAHVNGYKCDCD